VVSWPIRRVFDRPSDIHDTIGRRLCDHRSDSALCLRGNDDLDHPQVLAARTVAAANFFDFKLTHYRKVRKLDNQ